MWLGTSLIYRWKMQVVMYRDGHHVVGDQPDLQMEDAGSHVYRDGHHVVGNQPDLQMKDAVSQV